MTFISATLYFGAIILWVSFFFRLVSAFKNNGYGRILLSIILVPVSLITVGVVVLTLPDSFPN